MKPAMITLLLKHEFDLNNIIFTYAVHGEHIIFALQLQHEMCSCSTKAVISNTGIFVAIDNNTLYGSKLYIFLLCQKSLGY